jgi:hypothetical protein
MRLAGRRVPSVVSQGMVGNEPAGRDGSHAVGGQFRR